jgi:translocation and assembly module TamA
LERGLAWRADERLFRNLLGAAVERLRSDSDVVLSQRVRLGRTQDTQRVERLGFVEYDHGARQPVQLATARGACCKHSIMRL